MVQIPRAVESSHLLIMGDWGTGKSALIRQILCQLEARGDTAIVYDPALECPRTLARRRVRPILSRTVMGIELRSRRLARYLIIVDGR